MSAQERRVNDLYAPGILQPTINGETFADATPRSKSDDVVDRAAAGDAAGKEAVSEILERHGNEDYWSGEAVKEAGDEHVLFTWGATDPMNAGAIQIAKTDGVYFWNQDGKRFLDFNSMAMCLSHGHTPDPTIVDAVTKQMQTNAYAYPGMFQTPVRARLSKLLSEIVPGDINHFLFPSSGAEANEAAVRIARVMTGRHKVMTRYRSYHGATSTTMAMTGDQRRWPAEGGAHGHVHFWDPYPYSFSLGETEEEIATRSLGMLREQIAYEGGHTIACIVIETVTGTNGVLPPPPGYLAGIRQICDENGIMLVCDEVMAGFGRSGKLFAFCHEPSLVPDMVTFAKGVNGAFVPLGGIGVRDHIAEFFRTNAISIGSTYHSHPVALASAYAALQVMLRDDIVGNASRMESVMRECMDELLANHPSVKQCRNLGLFGAMDIQSNVETGEFVAKVTDPHPPEMLAFRKTMLENGVWTMQRGHTVFMNPPLIINEEQIREGFAAFDKALHETDKALEK